MAQSTLDIFVAGLNKIEIAIKTLKDRQFYHRFSTEILMNGTLKHENVIRMFGAYIHGEERSSFVEYMDMGSMESYLLKHCSSLTLSNMIGLLKDGAAGLDYIHSQMMLHNDLTIRNCLIKSTEGGALLLKIADFGLATPGIKYVCDGQSHMFQV